MTSRISLQVTAFGETRTPRDWLHHPQCVVAEETTLTGRIRVGWSPERAITTPVAQRSPTLLLAAFGKRMTLTAWAAQPECTVTPRALHYRLTVLGMTPEAAITTTPKLRGAGTAALIEA
jgi:hypothetical protein